MKVFCGQRFLVYGAGASGRAAKRAIKKRGGAAVLLSDRDGAFVTPHGAFKAAVISPGIRRDHPVYTYCARRGIPTMGEIELGFSLTDKPIVGVTGTNGKTTVTRLISDMLRCTACGNIGYPLTLAIDCKDKALCCELSSFQLLDAKNIAPRVAVITNIAPDHLDYHGSYEEYCRAKCNIASAMDEDAHLVLGDDVPIGALKYLKTRANIVRCCVNKAVDGAYVYNNCFYFLGERICPTDYLRLQGTHNIKNALCAIAAAKLMGVSTVQVIRALSTAQSEPHRIQYAGKACGKKWIDDSKSTNMPSTVAAVDAVCGSMALILGGLNKGLDFCELFCALGRDERKQKLAAVIGMGKSAEEIKECGKKYGFDVITADGLKSAVDIAADINAEYVLLSPACASFDEFNGYDKRGDAFRAAVAALGKK